MIARVEPRPRLHGVAIEIAASCNQKCAYCYNPWRAGGGRAIDRRERDKLLPRVQKLLDAFELEQVTLTGGEPFAHPHVFELLDLLRERGVGVRIVSNG